MEAAAVPSAANARRWPVALLVAFITALVAAVATAPVADWGTQLHHVSNFEGGRGYMVVCLWIPLGFVVGFVTGFVVSLLLGGHGFVGFLKRQGVALAALAVLLALAAGLSYATVDHPPLIDGKELALEIEVQVPAKGRSVAQLQAEMFQVALVVTNNDRAYSDLRWVDAVESAGKIFVTAWARLNSRNPGREITVGVVRENRQIFSVMLPASPKRTTDEWSEWAPPRGTFSGGLPPADDRYLVRYRVRFAEEYSPTPTPASEPDTSNAESDSPEATPRPSDQAGMPQSDALDRGLLPSPTETPR